MQFGKEAQQKILCQIKVSKPEEYCMYFPVWKLPSWRKRFAVTRRRNCAVLPKVFGGPEVPAESGRVRPDP